MAKRKRSSRGMSTGLKVFLVILGILGVGAGATAIATKGFEQWGEAEKLIKGGVTVDTFKIDSLSGTTATLVNKEGDELTIAIDGFIGENDEKLYLGDKETAPTTTKEALETMLHNFDFSNSKIADIEEEVLALDVCKYSTMELALNVEYEETAATSGAIELPWFDMVRVNYKIPASRYVVFGDQNDDKVSFSAHKRINTITPLYENISLFGLENEVTLSTNEISFTSFSIEAAKDNTIEIQSIELVRSTAGKHQNDLCWVTQA